MATKYIVKKGDTLSQIAKDNGTTVDKLVALNDITNPDYIVVGQELILSGTATTPTKNTSNKPIIKTFGLQSDTDRTVYATWKWDKSNTENYKVMWYFWTGDGTWWVGSDSTTEYRQSTYTAPENATSVKFKVKPIAKKIKKNGKETSAWTAEYSTEKKYSFSSNPPVLNNPPTVTIDGYKLRAEYTNLETNAKTIEFQVYKNDKKFATGTATIKAKDAAYTWDVDAGGSYKVRAQAVRDDETSGWTLFSDEVLSAPAAPASIKKLKAVGPNEITIDWENVSKAEFYQVQYTTKKKYFDSADGKVTTLPDIKASEAGHAEVPDLATGQEYFFRVRAKRGEQYSEWSEIKSIVIGKKPSAPTTWSSKTKVMVKEPVTLYWVHNTEDGSKQTEATIETTINGETKAEFYYSDPDENEAEPIYSKTIDTSSYIVGTKILWRVKTKGVTDEYSDYSVQRSIDVLAPVTLGMDITNAYGSSVSTISSFPFYIEATAGPNTQKPIGYHVVITADEAYDTVDHLGNPKIINKDEAVYSKYFDTSAELKLELSANNIDLENNQRYTVKCTVSMSSGLTATATDNIRIYWGEKEYTPTASMSFDKGSCVANISPACYNASEILVSNVLLSVYRREFDGSFTEIATGIKNSGYDTVTDLHPSLDVARYRIVATDQSTGDVSYIDISEPLGEKAVIIQWKENWTLFEATSEYAMEEPTWSGSLLRLPYNIDVSDSFKPDVALVEYIGREQPVSYYGTQLGSTSTWNVVIPKNDVETLYSLRRLAKWMGDVYVREPSGSGYWANITVSFSQKHRELTIPVTLNITRVAGGA